MSFRTDHEHLVDLIRARHQTLRTSGLVATIIGVLLAVYVAYRWFIWQTGHEIIALAAAVTLLIGVQLLVFSALTSMMVALHREVVHQTRNS